MARLFYRIRQFWQGIWASVTPEDRARVATVLLPAAIPLFEQMPIDGQRHSLNVLRSLWAGGHHEDDLAVAALLHDCGKAAAARGGPSLRLWARGPLLVLDKLFPSQMARWATSETPYGSGATVVQGWRYLLYVQREHAAIGAEWAAQAGCTPLSCWLIAHHQDTLAASEEARIQPEEAGRCDEALRLLALLQAADDGN